jgi:hypothetical protein
MQSKGALQSGGPRSRNPSPRPLDSNTCAKGIDSDSASMTRFKRMREQCARER